MASDKKPKISGFTFIKNGLSLGYPIRESVESIAPLCDEIIINVGFDDPELKKDDGTYNYLQNCFPGPKFKFIKNYWDPALKSQGLILSQQTNLALQVCQNDYCQYIQGDEVIHESDLVNIRNGVQVMRSNSLIDGLIFDYIHFYGNAHTVRQTRHTYRREVRLIRNHIGVQSWLDAQGFKHANQTKLKCILSHAKIYHYGWCRSDMIMKKKVQEMDKLFHQGKALESDFEYSQVWGLRPFQGQHPTCMQNWIKDHQTQFQLERARPQFNIKNLRLMISDTIENLTGIRLGEYKNFILIKNID